MPTEFKKAILKSETNGAVEEVVYMFIYITCKSKTDRKNKQKTNWSNSE